MFKVETDPNLSDDQRQKLDEVHRILEERKQIPISEKRYITNPEKFGYTVGKDEYYDPKYFINPNEDTPKDE